MTQEAANRWFCSLELSFEKVIKLVPINDIARNQFGNRAMELAKEMRKAINNQSLDKEKEDILDDHQLELEAKACKWFNAIGRCNRQLKKLKTPEFNGSQIERWFDFRAAFENFAEGLDETTQADQMRLALSGEAEKHVIGCTTIGEMWSALTTVYENPRFIEARIVKEAEEMDNITWYDASATLNWKAKLKGWQRDLRKVGLDKNTSLLDQLTGIVDNKMPQSVWYAAWGANGQLDIDKLVDEISRFENMAAARRRYYPKYQPNPYKQRSCHECGSLDHLVAKCTVRAEKVKIAQLKRRRCWKCGDRGHPKEKCPLLQVEKPGDVCQIEGPNNDPRVFTTMEIEDEAVTTLVDCGSIATIVPEAVVHEAEGAEIKTFSTAGGNMMKVHGPFEKEIQVGQAKPVEWPVYTQDSEVAILGADYLREHGAVIDMGTGKITMRSKKTSPESEATEVNIVGNMQTVGELVAAYDQLFEGIGLCTLAHHEIDTGNNKPICLGSRRIPFCYLEGLDKHVKDLLEKDIIEESCSQWCSPINPRPKKDGSIRLTIDFRELNQLTRWDAWPMPRIDEILNKLAGAKWFSRVDLRSGYYNIPLADESKEKTAFRYRNKLYQFKRMPMGLVTAPHTFQRLMTSIFGDLPFVECYLDDVVIFSETYSDHVKHLSEVLRRTKKANLKLNREKCQFGVNEVELLGSRISNGRRYPDTEKIQTMARFPIPENAKQTKAFLGFANYLRSALPNFAIITRPLVDASNAKKFEWSPACQESFEEVKKLVAANPMTFLPDLNKPFVVTTDASNQGMGAVLSQVINGEKRVVEFASKFFTPTQQRYSTIEKEATAILFALRKWRHFLLGQEITIETDHRPLQWLMTKRDCPDKLGRMAAELQEFRIKGIQYIEGESNILADTLSRLQVAVINHAPVHEDARIRRLVERFPDKYVREGNRIVMIDGDYRRICIENQDERNHILRKIHDEAGHLRYDKTVECIRKRFYWPNWQRYVKQYLRDCSSCAKKKDDIEPNREKLKPQESKEPMERVHVDICGQLTESDGNKYFAVMVDSFTKWTEAEAFRSVKASDIIRWLREVFDRLGTPRKITTDHGSQFDSREFRNFCEEMGVELHLTTVGHHESNGLAEREIQTVEKMLRTSIVDQHDWSRVLQRCVTSYNTRKHAATGYSPHVLMFGEEPVLDIDEEYHLTLPAPNLAQVREDAKVKMEKAIHKARHYYDREFRPSNIKVGDKVLWHTEEIGQNKSRKLNRRWRGPFVVSELQRPLAIVEDSLEQRRPIHLNQLKVFHKDEELDTFRGRGRPRNVGEV